MPSLTEELRKRTELLTTSQVMRLLSKRRNTICDWVRDGCLPATRLGNSYRYDPAVIASWLDQHAMHAGLGVRTR